MLMLRLMLMLMLRLEMGLGLSLRLGELLPQDLDGALGAVQVLQAGVAAVRGR